MNESQKNKLSIKMLISLFIILIVIPVMVVLGQKLASRHYYLISVAIIIATIASFFLSFENRKPQARELVLIAVLCAIAVVSRAAFIMLPSFKPITAIIMISGIAFGAEAGFLTGSVAAFVSNFIFGQGPWTPWQMFAFGLAGFIAGLLFKKDFIRKKRVLLSICGGLLVLLVVGPLLDVCSLFTMTTELTKESVGAIFKAGLILNAVHAGATFLTLLLLSKVMLEKLERVKIKYGLNE